MACQMIVADTADQGRREYLRGPGQNFNRGPYDVSIFKQQD